MAVFAIPMVVASTAWACGRLATLYLSSDSGRPGSEVTFTGRNYNTAPTSSDVFVRFNSRSGQVLAQARADASGRISGTLTVPSARRGNYVIVATQTTANGAQASGTPGRAPFRVRRASSSSSALPLAPAMWGDRSGPSAPQAAPASSQTSSSNGSGFSLPLAAWVLLGLSFGGAAIALVARRVRSTLLTAE